MAEPAYMTHRGRNLLEARVADFEAQLRVVLGAKAEAAEVGGNSWHDNFAFEQLCRDELALLRRIAELRQLIQRGCPPPARDADEVGIGCRVVLEHESGVQRELVLVGYGEGVPDDLIIEYVSPLGRALFGAHVGDEIQTPVPRMKGVWTIMSVQLASNTSGLQQ